MKDRKLRWLTRTRGARRSLTVSAFLLAIAGAPGSSSAQPDYRSMSTGPWFRMSVCLREDPTLDYCLQEAPGDPDMAVTLYADSDDWVAITFESPRGETEPEDPIKLSPSQVGFLSVDLEVDGKTRKTKSRSSDDSREIVLRLDDLESAPHGSLITVRVRFDGANDSTDYSWTRYFMVKNRFVPYGIAGKPIYFWLPVALAATDFSQGKNGIAFSAFPVGTAVGFRWYLAPEFYVGFSAMANWAIYANSTESGAPATDSTRSSYSLTGLSVGGLVDINNWLFLGGAHGFDLRRDEPNPGWLFVGGIAPGIIQFVKSAD